MEKDSGTNWDSFFIGEIDRKVTRLDRTSRNFIIILLFQGLVFISDAAHYYVWANYANKNNVFMP